MRAYTIDRIVYGAILFMNEMYKRERERKSTLYRMIEIFESK